MNTRIRKSILGTTVVLFTLFVGRGVINEYEVNKLRKKNATLLSYVEYSVEMVKDLSVEYLNFNIVLEKNSLIYCFSEDMCDECIYQDLAELYRVQQEIGKDKVLLLPVYRMERENQIILKNKLNNFRYMNASIDSIRFPFHRENGTEQRFFAFTDEVGRIKSLFFPEKNRSNLTRIYLSGVKNRMK